MQKNKATSWQDDFRFGLKNISSVNSFFGLEIPHINYDINIPFNLANKIREAGESSALWKQFIPSIEETHDLKQTHGLEDPIGDQIHAKDGGLVHRYNNRALFFPTTICPVICRYCFRKNELSDESEIFDLNFKKTLSYLNQHSEIEEIIFSGGDPLMLSNSKIEYYLSEFSKISNIKYIRFHSRSPISMPLRIDAELVTIFQKFSAHFEVLTLAVHINHASELDEEVATRLRALQSIKHLKLLSQTVLLHGINNSVDDLATLLKAVVRNGISPYYLHHPDKVKGGMHFQVDIEAGRKIYANLRDILPGWMIPTYIFDIPGGHGKQPLFNPEAIEFSGELLSKHLKLVRL